MLFDINHKLDNFIKIPSDEKCKGLTALTTPAQMSLLPQDFKPAQPKSLDDYVVTLSKSTSQVSTITNVQQSLLSVSQEVVPLAIMDLRSSGNRPNDLCRIESVSNPVDITQQISLCRDYQELSSFYNLEDMDSETVVLLFEKTLALNLEGNQFDEIKNSKSFDKFLQFSARKVPEFDAKDFIKIARVAAKLKVQHPSLCIALTKRAETDLAKFDGSDIASLAWAFATLKIGSGQLLRLFARELVQKDQIKDLSAAELANVGWAFSDLKAGATLLFDKIAEQIPAKLEGFTPYEIVSLYGSFSKARPDQREVLLLLVKRAGEILDIFPSYVVAKLAHEIASTGGIGKEIFPAIAQQIILNPEKFSIGHLISILWAFATTRIFDEELMKVISKRIKSEITLNPTNFEKSIIVANTAWALATLDFFDQELLDAIAGQALKVKDYIPQGIANVISSFAVFDYDNVEFFEEMFSKFRFTELAITHKTQLRTSYLHCEMKNPGRTIKIPNFAKKQMLQGIEELKNARYSVSNEENRVFDLISTLKKGGKQGLHVDIFSLDIAFEEEKIAIEYDGPCHFTDNGQRRLGNNKLRDRILSSMGWTVIRIPYFEWDPLDPNEKLLYLQEKLGLK